MTNTKTRNVVFVDGPNAGEMHRLSIYGNTFYVPVTKSVHFDDDIISCGIETAAYFLSVVKLLDREIWIASIELGRPSDEKLMSVFLSTVAYEAWTDAGTRS